MTPIHRSTVACASLVSGAVTAPAGAADLEAGAELARQCAACHGVAGISTAPDYPNLSAQKQEYLAAQLTAFQTGDRSNPLMNAIAAQLSKIDIENLAAHFASIPGAGPGEMADNVAGLDGTRVDFPADFEETFTRYQRLEFEDRKQIRFYLANNAALEGARAGGPFPSGAYLLVEIYDAELDAEGNLARDDEGALIQTDLVGYTAMEKQDGWGEAVPELLRNGNWRYSGFDAEGEHRAATNEAPCLACHVPLTETDYTFTYEALTDFVEAN